MTRGRRRTDSDLLGLAAATAAGMAAITVASSAAILAASGALGGG